MDAGRIIAEAGAYALNSLQHTLNMRLNSDHVAQRLYGFFGGLEVRLAI